jgi:hypothetical protein
VDIILHDTFEYENVTTERVGGMDWNLLFVWNYNMKATRNMSIPSLDSPLPSPITPIPSPTMAGGLFAIHKEFFLRLGGYDEGIFRTLQYSSPLAILYSTHFSRENVLLKKIKNFIFFVVDLLDIADKLTNTTRKKRFVMTNTV